MGDNVRTPLISPLIGEGADSQILVELHYKNILQIIKILQTALKVVSRLQLILNY